MRDNKGGGIVICAYRKLDRLGRVVIPKQLLQKHKINPKDMLEVSEDAHGTIVVVPVRTVCAICGGSEKLIPVHGQFLCSECLSAAQK